MDKDLTRFMSVEERIGRRIGLVLACVVVVITLILFLTRKSETADTRPTPQSPPAGSTDKTSNGWDAIWHNN